MGLTGLQVGKNSQRYSRKDTGLKTQFVELYFTPAEILWAFCRTNRRFEFRKRGQLFIGACNETPALAAIVRLQSRSFARWNQSQKRSPNSKRLC